MNILRGAFSGVTSNEFFSLIQTTEARECLRSAKEAFQSFSQVTEVHWQFSNWPWLISMLEDMIESSKKANRFTGGINREKLWVNYQKQTSSNEFASKWNDFCHKIRVPMMSLFYQRITDEVLNFY